MIYIRKKNPKYKLWLKRRQKKRMRIISTKKRRTKHNLLYNIDTPHIRTTKKPTRKSDYEQVVVTAPENFSIVNNTREITNFFDEIRQYINNKKEQKVKFFFDLSFVTIVTTDAIMYLLALIKNLQHKNMARHQFSGNAPKDKIANKIFMESGFYDFVKSKAAKITNTNNVAIRTGQSNDGQVLKEICDFIIEKAHSSRIHTKFIYKLMAEMMYNTQEHAYGNESVCLKNWYVFIAIINERLNITFLDTGAGIPKTMNKKWHEKFLNARNCDLILSALRGDTFSRSQTKLPYRNNGLPTIRKYAEEQTIKNLHILSNKAICLINDINGNMVYDLDDQKTSIMGTIFYWEIPISNLQGECL